MDTMTLESLGIPNPDTFGQSSGDDQTTQDSINNSTDPQSISVESRLDSIFGNREQTSNQQSQQPENKNQGDATQQKQTQPQQTTAGQQQAQTQQPTTSNQQPAGQTQPQQLTPELFADASKKTFIGDDGQLNTQKVNDYFLTGKNSLLSQPIVSETVTEAPKSEVTEVDPVQDYQKAVSEIYNNMPQLLDELQKKGMSIEQGYQAIKEHVSNLAVQRDMKASAIAEVKKYSAEFAKELAESRENKITAQIHRNVTELARPLDGLVPGVPGEQVLNQFILSPKYGGQYLDKLFRDQNPGYKNLKPEELKETSSKWFRKFQSDPEAMAMVAEFGRARWLVEQLPAIMQHGQQIGAQKAANAHETRMGGPTNMQGQQMSSGYSQRTNQFLGIDSVN